MYNVHAVENVAIHGCSHGVAKVRILLRQGGVGCCWVVIILAPNKVLIPMLIQSCSCKLQFLQYQMEKYCQRNIIFVDYE